MNPTVGDFTGNKRKILEFAQRAADDGADLVAFPELAVCGYPPGDLLEKPAFVARSEDVVQEIATESAQKTPSLALLLGYVRAISVTVGKHVANVAGLWQNGKLQFEQQKTLLPYYDVFDEQRYFAPGVKPRLLRFGGETVAVTICEDAWNDKDFWPRPLYEVDPVEALLNGGSTMVLNISASPFYRRKPRLRREMLATLARSHRCPVAMVNQVGGNDSLVFDGSSFVLGADGELLAQAASFAEDLLLVDTCHSARHAPAPRSTVAETKRDDAEVYNALVLGTRDYVRKCGFQSVMIGLSGGIDSALVAAIAAEALGPGNVMGVLMPSQYSSQGSLEDAAALARNLGIRAKTIPIREAFHAFDSSLAPLFTGKAADLTEENLQSRIRGTILMALSNKLGALVLSTGNKSEMSVGYCTLYGDMVGALAVIADVFKTDVYRLCGYVNRERELIPRATMEKPPSAELRPGQQDTDSLPPYDVLDPILEAYVERYATAEEIAKTTGSPLSLVKQMVSLVERSEYKRQQAAPVLKVTRKSFGMGRRFPIAQKTQA